MNISTPFIDYCTQARQAYRACNGFTAAQRTAAIEAMANAVAKQQATILTANAEDMRMATHLSDALRDRLLLTNTRLQAMVEAMHNIAQLPDMLGVVQSQWQVVHNGLHIARITVPIGVVGMIYESRPNVTADAATIAIKSGNVIILRGGSESTHSNTAITNALQAGLQAAAFPKQAVQTITSTDRSMVDAMLAAYGQIDVLIPRGGKNLTEKVARESRVPTLLHLTGNCHSYVHQSADIAAAIRVVTNAKMRRTGVCGATETVLIDANIAPNFLPVLATSLVALGCELRGCAKAQALDARIIAATEEDWATEFLAPIVAIKIVADITEATDHIARYGSGHTDAILAQDTAAIAQFTHTVCSAIVMVNASTQFADGGEFGFGGEIGIATGKLPPRGPIGPAQLTSYHYVVTGNHAVRA
jgi:glutamate-5-semialdehyde dehydrogenase